MEANRQRQAREAADDTVQHLTMATYADAAGDTAQLRDELAAALASAKTALRLLTEDGAGGLARSELRRGAASD